MSLYRTNNNITDYMYYQSLYTKPFLHPIGNVSEYTQHLTRFKAHSHGTSNAH